MNSAGVEHVHALAALAMGIPVAEIVHVTKWFSRLRFDESFELLQEISAVRRLVTGKYLDDPARRVR